MKYLDHLRELRNRILFSFLFLFFELHFFFFYYNVAYLGDILTAPLFSILENSSNKRMIFTALPEVFVSNLKISLFASFLISTPIFIIQIIIFISPALYKNEKKFFIPIIILSPFFFYQVFYLLIIF